MRAGGVKRHYMMGVVMFLMCLPPGMWLPSLPNILASYEARWVLPYFYALTPCIGIFSALLFSALSDRKLDAGRLLGSLGLTGAVFVWLSFSSLRWGWHPSWFLMFQCLSTLISAPMIPLITKVKLANLPNPEKSFPLYSVCGTIGWLSGSILVSVLALDYSAQAGQLAVAFRVCMSLLCFTLPATPPKDRSSRGWQAALGLRAFGLLRDPELRRFYLASALLSIPGVAHFMIAPTLLAKIGSTHPAAAMSFGQAAEVGAMLFLSAVAGRFRMRGFLVWGMSLAVLRFALFAFGAETGTLLLIYAGIALHGPVYTFVTVAGRVYLDKRVPETLQGQAQALYSLLVFNLAGIVGAFVCEWLYQVRVESASSWLSFWLILSALAALPLLYFTLGLLRQSSNEAC